jgi:ribosome modulation factor
VQNLEKKLTEASSFLNGWRNGKNLVGDGKDLVGAA